MTRFLLIRHGESEANKNNVFAGHLDAKLSERGLEQARETAKFVAEKYKVDKVYASDLQRAFITGKTSADLLGLETVPMSELREIHAGKWDGMVFSDIRKAYSQDFERWQTDIGNAHCTEGETTAQLYHRIMTALNGIADENEGKTVLIATHATPIRVALTQALYGDVLKMKQVAWVSNASVTELIRENGVWTAVEISQDKHLDKLKTVLPPNV